jgi:hypothetical protein
MPHARRLKEGYDSDDEYGEGGSAHTKYEERRSRKAGKDHDREQQRAVNETKKMNKMVTNVSTSRICVRRKLIVLSGEQHPCLETHRRWGMRGIR